MVLSKMLLYLEMLNLGILGILKHLLEEQNQPVT